MPCPAFGGKGGVKGHNTKEISFPGSPALCAESFTNKIGSRSGLTGAYLSSPLVPVLRSSSATKDGGEGRLRGKPSALCLPPAGIQGFERELRVEKLRLLSLRAERSNPTKSLRGHSPWQSQQFPLPCGERVGVREKLYTLCPMRFALFKRGLTSSS